jgi:anti-sigma factor RsiW
MTCRDALRLLHDHLDGQLEPSVDRDLQRHLADCPGCLAFLKTYQKTVGLSGELRQTDIPPELQERLKSFLKQRRSKP